jgi:hypothetical protein
MIKIIQTPLFYQSLFQDLGLEILFLTMVLSISITIYKITKEPYQITGHKGIKYFRNAFLFFGIAYLFRFLFYFLSYVYNYELINYLDLSPRMLGGGSIIIYAFTSSVALISLLYALSYNKFKKTEMPEYYIYFIAAIISIASFFVFNIILITHVIIAIVIILSITLQKNILKNNALGFAYIGLALFWILSIFGDLFYFLTLYFFRPVLYSFLTVILLFISFRTIKRVG